MNNNNKISFTTERVEELWTELSQAWPAVKNNPEIAEKIEKLWDILKASGNDHLAINKEIQNLLESNNNNSILTSSSISSIEATPDSLHSTIQADQDLDSLLAEILGENYQDELNQTDNNQNIPDSSNINSGTEELDKLVAAILGDDWLKDSTTTDNPSSYNSHISKPTQNIDSLVSSIIGNDFNEESGILAENQKLIDDKQDIDELLNEILNKGDSNKKLTGDNKKPEENVDELINKESNFVSATSSLSNIANEEQSQITEPNQKENIDDLINEILNKDSDFTDATSSLSSNEEITTDGKAKENIDNLINEILNKEPDFTNTTSSLSSNKEITIEEKPEENIDNLINEVLNKDSELTNTISSLSNIANKEQSQITEPNQKENIDDLINEVLNKDSDFTDTTSSLSSNKKITTDEKPEENIEDLINEILNDKTDTNSISDELNIEEIHIQANKDNSSHQADDDQIFKKVTASSPPGKTEPTYYKQPEKQGSNTLIIIILIILMLGIVGVWKLFFNKEEMATQIATTKKQHTDIVSSSEEVTTIIKEATEERDTLQTIKDYQYKTEPEYSPPAMEQSTDNNETAYSALIEQDENDITIILNSPETAIESNDSTVFNTNEAISTIETEPSADDNINTIESITEPTSPTDTLSKNELIPENKPIIEKTKQEKPVKTVAKRKVIIHKIVKGDTLWAIAKRYVNNPYRYPELAKLSKIKNPNRIYPGNKVRIIIYTK